MAENKCSEAKPVAAMVAVEIAFASVNILIKKVLDEGMAVLVFVTYRVIASTLFLAPLAHFLERGTLTLYLFILGLGYTTATFTCAFINMVPIATFLMALPFGLEEASLKRKAGRAKVLGTVVSASGAMLLTLYKGVALTNTSPSREALQVFRHVSSASNRKTDKWTIGTIALVGACLSWSSWFLIQARIGKSYPALYSSTALMFFLSALQSGILGLATDRSISLWALKGKQEILTVLYSGIVGSGLGFVVMSWCVKKRGPLFTAAFSPLIQIVVAIIDVSILHETLHLGSVLGSLLVILGLYILLWGKSMETRSSVAKQLQAIEDGETQTHERPDCSNSTSQS
ncbi:WAT1-related protein At3g30340-like isoform X2 [Aristolochia californica]|uniref:WAT1-related protein At3g30340-like isoform X2 n=1 Tax=Aristolochia californica TaxID=171875 RepID=UPI0035D937E9